ncbi:hypothetical protein CONCODRAFT_69440 [Conidiobolus coronatus NRRL 28638]|uniref:Uncharacterized protein n=1 Tax=Conidiobolus coronatus (strain ATCC 28846 / CBS 209.66 / NRRL 28638) TaxID=796925 RepID=A0A137PAE9_CONC2|nr:hypothetical protein CONCODRAFT_69440 [Conidiobolus coronatus NRRL 28638]|eukprot:KXN71980.1 hypothetical protein CONCODRAFT_69440 [Conidiobolus coronatus NRRL 28638]
MDSDEELFVENKTRLRSSFEQLILKYSNVSSQEIEEYDLNTGEGYIIPNPLDPSLRNISHNDENLWKFPDFKDFIPEQSQAEDEEVNYVSASNSENEDSISDNNSESDISSGEDEESNSEEETFSSEAELSDSENIETILDSQPFEEKLNSKTNFSTGHNEAKSVSLKDKEDPSYISKLEVNLLASEDLESDFDKEFPSPDVKLSDSDYPEDQVNSIHCKNSESSSDEKDTPSSTQGDKSESDVRNSSNENNTIKISDKDCSKNLSLSERHLPNSQILIESTEKSGLNDDNNLEIDEKPVSVKRRSKKISSKSISKVDKLVDNKSVKKAVTIKAGPKGKSRGVNIATVEPISSKSNSKVDKVDDNSESKACDGIKCEKMFCLMCDSLNS